VANRYKRLPILVRIGLLVLAALPVLIRPMYSTWCETHQLGHALAALSHHKFRADSSVEKQLDIEHARGEHGLLHSDDGGVYAGVAAVVAAPAVQFESVLNPSVIALPAPVQRLDRLLRPPIA
jgi:hypothetical protein